MSRDSFLGSVLWVERYRPTDLADMALPDDTRRLLQSWLDAGEIPHVLLIGPPGTGKTAIAQILIRGIDCSVLKLNASSERGIDTIRDQVARFARSKLTGKKNTVFLDEADELTRDAQTALRNTMEQYASRTRFILTGNSGYKIIGAIQSRCSVIEQGPPPFKERARILMDIVRAELPDKALDPDTVLSYVHAHRDMRRMISAAQMSVQTHGKLVPAALLSFSGEDVFKKVVAKDYRGLVALTNDSSFDHAGALRELFFAIPDEHPQAASWRATVGKSVHESGYTPDSVVLFLATCADLISTI